MKYAFLDLPKPVTEEIIKTLIELRDTARNSRNVPYGASAHEQHKALNAYAEYMGALKIAKILGIDETLIM